jgi:hypothetical protein
MNPWVCVFLITSAEAIGGVVNAFLTDNGFAFPTKVKGVWCPGVLGNVLVGGVSAFISWALYGSGATVNLAAMTERAQISFTFPALAGALVVGVAGSKWLTNEADKSLLKKSVMEAAGKTLSPQQCKELQDSESPRKMLASVVAA